MKIAKASVLVNCPVCYSGNSFDLAASEQATLVCEDCGFILSEDQNAIDSGRCIFCGNEKFYAESFLSLTFLGNFLVCYVCEAKYKGVKVKNPDEKFNEATANQLRFSEAAINLKKRVELYY